MNDTTARRPHRRLTSGRAGVALGVVALTFSLGLPSEAANLINGKNLKNNSVTGKKIKNNTLTGKDVKNDSITGKDVKESSLKGLLATGDIAAFGDSATSDLNDFTENDFTSVVSTSVTAPSDGVLYITGSISAEDDSSLAGQGRLLYRLSLDGSSLDGGAFPHELHFADLSGSGDSGAVTGVVPVTAGTHTVSLDAEEIGSGTFITSRDVSVLFVPTGSGFVPSPKAATKKSATSAQAQG